MLVFKLLRESFLFAADALRQNRLRTILSLLGITIGIMTIIGVFSAVDTFRASLQSSVDKLGSKTIYVHKMPWAFGGDYPWWKYVRRPSPNIRDFEKLTDRVKGAEAISYDIGAGSRTIKYKSTSIEGVRVSASTYSFFKTRQFNIAEGRYFTEGEFNAGRPLCIIGTELAEGLFPNQKPIGKVITVMGRKVTVVGIFELEGESPIGITLDNTVFLPLNFIRNVIDIKSDRYQPQISIAGKAEVPIDDLESELRGVIRSIHSLSPKEEDDFALNKSTMLTAQLDSLFGIVNIAGAIIGGFSILVGGFGISNIMFVSVRERTNIIGIQKSLGAKNYFILLQFLFEAVALCIMGGILGLLVIYILSFLAKTFFEFEIIIDLGKVYLTFVLSTAIGLISGFIPAFMASRLDPVEAIRSK